MLALWRHDGGTLIGDMETETLEYRSPPTVAS